MKKIDSISKFILHNLFDYFTASLFRFLPRPRRPCTSFDDRINSSTINTINDTLNIFYGHFDFFDRRIWDKNDSEKKAYNFPLYSMHDRSFDRYSFALFSFTTFLRQMVEKKIASPQTNEWNANDMWSIMSLFTRIHLVPIAGNSNWICASTNTISIQTNSLCAKCKKKRRIETIQKTREIKANCHPKHRAHVSARQCECDQVDLYLWQWIRKRSQRIWCWFVVEFIITDRFWLNNWIIFGFNEELFCAARTTNFILLN